MDQKVKRLESEVAELSIGQKKILDRLDELVDKVNSRPSPTPANLEHEAENSMAPLRYLGERSGNIFG
ncbi:hypothetical protein FRX31_026399, partial [Thalictrum thalictroides]